MKLNRLYARFYKSFNFDELRKAHPEAKPNPWEIYDDGWFPFVEVPIERQITTIVGANESGKSHLLSAIEMAITGKRFQQRDLCRFSPFFHVEQGKACWPHLGAAWTNVDKTESDAMCAELNIDLPEPVQHFLMFREGPDKLVVYLPSNPDSFNAYTLEGDKAQRFGADFLPQPFRIKAGVALPDSASLAWLINPNKADRSITSRSERARLIQAGSALLEHWRPDPNEFAAQASRSLHSITQRFFSVTNPETEETTRTRDELSLARDLLIRLARVDPKRLKDLLDAITQGDEGHANALVTKINGQLAQKLNFPRWWVQDRDFSLQVTSRDFDLVFTIRDRTGTEYTFAERSSGLKYFLSYLIQSQIHQPSANSEILLMDEPDAYLSAEAQQDLLKIFEAVAMPEGDRQPLQVVYVTHSPFLIDKNHAERIRVLQKGKAQDGTRVIKNASQNHYEPLRSALGSFVGETAFIGACNLLVEGSSDQIILSGLSRVTRRLKPGIEDETLNLNRLVIVPCGSASQMPYMVYLIRGRDAEKPPIIALLDSDPEANKAAELMRGKDKKLRRLIAKDYVLQLGDLKIFADETRTSGGIEDLVPMPLALAAANQCLAEISNFRDEEQIALTEADIGAHCNRNVSLVDGLNAAASVKGRHIEKIAFARAIVHLCSSNTVDSNLEGDVQTFIESARTLFRQINKMRRKAEKEASRDQVGTRVHREVLMFFRDHPDQTTRENAKVLFDQITGVLDDSVEADDVRIQLGKLRREFLLDEDLAETVPNYEKFKERSHALRHIFDAFGR